MPERPLLILPGSGEPLERQKRSSGGGTTNWGKAVPLCECAFPWNRADRGDVQIAGVGGSAEHPVFAERSPWSIEPRTGRHSASGAGWFGVASVGTAEWIRVGR